MIKCDFKCHVGVDARKAFDSVDHEYDLIPELGSRPTLPGSRVIRRDKLATLAWRNGGVGEKNICLINVFFNIARVLVSNRNTFIIRPLIGLSWKTEINRTNELRPGCFSIRRFYTKHTVQQKTLK